MNKIKIPHHIKCLYMHFLTNGEGWLHEFLRWDGGYDFINKYADDRFLRDSVAKILIDRAFCDSR